MKSAYHSLIITVAIVLVYGWLKTPILAVYSLQLFAVVVLGYFAIKRVHRARFWQLLPTHASIEMAVLTMGFLLLIGATGNLHSVLFATSFIHLFIIALKTDVVTACITTMEIVLFHYALTPNPSLHELSFLASLPLVLVFFVFAKAQYQQVFHDHQALLEQQAQLSSANLLDQKLEAFLGGLLEDKLARLQRLSFFPLQNQRRIQAEMAEIALLTDELIAQAQAEKATQNTTADSTPDSPALEETIDIFTTTVTTTLSPENTPDQASSAVTTAAPPDTTSPATVVKNPPAQPPT